MLFSLRIKDARLLQIIFQAIFLLYGTVYLHWLHEGAWFLYYVLASVVTQFLFEWKRNNFSTGTPGFWDKFYNGCKSALITAFGLCLLLKTNHWYICTLAAFISIAGKFILQYRGKHLFNPSALGIVLTIILTRDAWISPGQWGTEAFFIFFICCFGGIIVTKVQKLDVTITFLGTYVLLLFVRQLLYLNWPVDYFTQSVATGSLLLFSFFMISDPKTAPDHAIARIVWAFLIGTLSFYFAAFKFIDGAPVWVLILSAPLVPLLDTIFKSEKFQWATHSLPNITRHFTTGLRKISNFFSLREHKECGQAMLK